VMGWDGMRVVLLLAFLARLGVGGTFSGLSFFDSIIPVC
jgi:hypothetical protein